MKFGAKFRSYAVPEWQQHYVDYQCLKSLLKQQKKKIEASTNTPGYLAKLLPAHWQGSSETVIGENVSGLPLPATTGPLGSRVSSIPGRPVNGGGPGVDTMTPQKKTSGPEGGNLRRQTKGRDVTMLEEPLLQQAQQQQREQLQNPDGLAPNAGGLAEGLARRVEAVRGQCVEAFGAAVEKEKEKVAAFFRDELGFLEDKLHAVSMELKAFNAARKHRISLKGMDSTDSIPPMEKEAVNANSAATGASHEGKTITSQDAAYLRRLERILLLLLDTLDKLEVYKRLNLLAFWKALKKRDKQLGLQKGQAVKEFEGVTAFFSQQLRIPPKTRRIARSLYRQVAGEDSELSLDVLPLRTAGGAGLVPFHREARVWFLAGCLMVLCLLGATMLFLPMPPSASFDYAGLMAVFPLFRLAFAWSFVWLSTASAMAVMERYGVNYRFLLDLAPRGYISSISFFSTAVLHFVVTTVTVVLYLADSKLRLLGDHQMYHFYPLGLLLFQALFLVFPSSSLTYKARRQVLKAFVTVLKAGVFAVGDVKLVANIIGDALTSLAKPLGDLQYLFCYLSKGMDTSGPAQCYGDSVVRPLLLGLPFYLRLCQCCIRFRGAEPGGGLIHLMNMAKYACGILVLITTNVPWLDLGVSVYAMCLLWVFSYCLGSLFMLYWDVRVDWGLLPTPDRFIRMQGRLMYPGWLYGAIAVSNVMGRLTWAMTLMPISIVGNKSLSGNLVLLFISVIEILRRGAWVVLRLENEHVNNSSRFRAILWVPPLHQTRLEMLEGDPLIQATTPSAYCSTRGVSFPARIQDNGSARAKP